MQFIFIVKSEELKIHISQFDQDLDCSFTASLKSVEFTGESDGPDHCKPKKMHQSSFQKQCEMNLTNTKQSFLSSCIVKP